VINVPDPRRRPFSRKLVRAAHDPLRSPEMTVGELVSTLGDRSFGWCIVLFAVLNMLPLPLGATVLTSLPLILITGQMALGMETVWLPGIITRRKLGRRPFKRLIMRMRPVMRPVERVVRPRLETVFAPKSERALGVFLFLVSVALFFPVPVNTWLLAISLLLAGLGLVERDGLLVISGVAIGVIAIAITVVVGALVINGAHAFAG
jgi:hypothetical protein